MKVLITGGDGMLAKELMKIKQDSLELIPEPRQELDVTDIQEIEDIIYHYRPIDVLLHCAALTRPMSKHEKDPALSIETNIIGTANIALTCLEWNIKPVFISTDYVYRGDRVGLHEENDPLRGVNYYGWSKIAGECSIRMVPNHLILRCGFCSYPYPHDQAPTDSYKSLIYVQEGAEIILSLIEKNVTGIINVGGPRIPIYEFAKKSKPDVKPIWRDEICDDYPYDTSMDVSKMKKIIEC